MMDLYERHTTYSRVYFRLLFPSSKQTIVISRAHIEMYEFIYLLYFSCHHFVSCHGSLMCISDLL